MASSSPSPDPILDAEWQKWKIKHGKPYSLVGNFGTVQREPREFADGGNGHNRGHRNCLFLKNYMNSHEHRVVRISVPRHVTRKISHRSFLFPGGRRTEESSMGRKYEKDQTAQWGEWPGEAWFHHGNECLW